MLKNIRVSSYKDFIAIIVVVLTTDFAPPVLRIFGSKAWTHLGISEGQWTILQASRGLIFIIFVLAAGVFGDFFGRRRVFLLTMAGFICCITILAFSPLFSLPFVITYTLWAIFGVMIKTLAIT